MFRTLLMMVMLFISAGIASAQDIEMADQFRADGKIYVVIGVILLLLIGLFIYLFRIERKVKKLEK